MRLSWLRASSILGAIRCSTAFAPQQLSSSLGGSSFIITQNGASDIRSASSRGSMQLNMMFDQLTNALTNIAKTLGPRKRITENSIKPALREVRRALLDADVNIDVADTLIDGVKKRTLGEEVIKGVTADQQFIKAMYDELLDVMGGDSSVQSIGMGVFDATPAATLAVGSPGNPAVVLLAGLQGAGKTTAAGKLALYLKEREADYSVVSDWDDDEDDDDDEVEDILLATRRPKRCRKVLLAAADVYRPAAITQLEILGKSIDVEVFSMGSDADPVDIAKQAVEKAKREGFDTVIVDTAGRQVIDANLMAELRNIKKAVNPDETLLVVDAMTGQEAASLTAAFDSAVGLTGAILTKMDGDSRGGAAVSVRGVSGKPIKFVGTGERTADLEPFYPDRMASRILGMGDVVSLVEKAVAQVSEEQVLKMQEKMMKAAFDFDDFLQQAKLVSSMGNFAGVAKMLPGIAGKIDNSMIRAAEARLKKDEALICSMTKQERRSPDLLITDSSALSRLKRIAKGSGLKLDEARTFISEFQRMRTIMSRMSKDMLMDDEAMAGDDLSDMAGNRALRRASKKKNKAGRGLGKGFG